MFELTAEEASTSRSQFVTLKRGENLKYLPYAFTEHGVLMLANVLKSKSAIESGNLNTNARAQDGGGILF